MHIATVPPPDMQRRAAAVVIDRYRDADSKQVLDLLAGLPSLYPGADTWLLRRLSQVSRGQAHCDVARLATGGIVGVTIDTPKTAYRWKLSTIYVLPIWRARGVGSALVDACAARWAARDVRENVVTVRLGRERELLRLLAPYGFSQIDVQSDRYGPGRTEVILRRLGR
ncbi:MAG: hypothetical protein RLZZ450_306 [Pseudomonadota bacterium]